MRAPLLTVAVFAALGVVVLGIVFAGATVGTAFDTSVQLELWQLGSPWLQIGMLVDFTAEPVGSVLVFGGLVYAFVRKGHRRAAVFLLAGAGASVFFTTALKPLVGRDINNGFLAFPSGHTASMTAVTLVIMLVVIQRRGIRTVPGMLLLAAVTIPAATAMAWAQVLENAHYPTDTLGGFCVALAVVPPTGLLVDAIADRRARRAGRPVAQA